MFSINDLREGKCAVINDGTVEELRTIIVKAFPNSTAVNVLSGSWRYYMKSKYDNSYIDFCDIKPNIPCQSVSDFLKQIKNERIFTPKFADEILASNDDIHWFNAFYISNINNKYLISNQNPEENYLNAEYIKCRFVNFIREFKIKISKHEIAKINGCNVKNIEIID